MEKEEEQNMTEEAEITDRETRQFGSYFKFLSFIVGKFARRRQGTRKRKEQRKDKTEAEVAVKTLIFPATLEPLPRRRVLGESAEWITTAVTV